jgi:hypothetical protein
MGACGQFFMYFISKHKNFLHYDIEYVSDNYMADYYSLETQGNNSHITFMEEDRETWYYEKIPFSIYVKQFNKVQKNKIIIRPAPHGKYKVKINNIGIDILQLQKHIMLDCDNWDWVYNRNEKYMLQFTTKYSKEYYDFIQSRVDGKLGWEKTNIQLCNFFKQHNCEYAYINPHKLLKLDNVEYNNLLTFIREKPLTNWKKLITEYVTTINLKV